MTRSQLLLLLSTICRACIFNVDEIIPVSDTDILVGLTTSGAQYTIYQNKVGAFNEGDESAAMILPVRGNFEGFINLEEHRYLFKQLKAEFLSLTNSRSAGSTSTPAIVIVGNYIATYVPNLESFDSLVNNPEFEKFNLKPNIRLILETHYPMSEQDQWGFVIGKLHKPGVQHPLGFLSRHISLSGPQPVLFVPTRHAHGDIPKETATFDHNIFAVNFGFEKALFVDSKHPENGWYLHEKGAPLYSTESLRGSPVLDARGKILPTFAPEEGNIISWVSVKGEKTNTDMFAGNRFDEDSFVHWLLNKSSFKRYFHDEKEAREYLDVIHKSIDEIRSENLETTSKRL